MLKFVATAAMAAVLLAPLGVGAQTPLPLPGSLPPYSPGIGLDVARKMLDAAVAEAGKNGRQEAIAIVDSGGRLVAFFRMDNTQLAASRSRWARRSRPTTSSDRPRPCRNPWRPEARPRACRGCPA